jgi:hypothetical protein
MAGCTSSRIPVMSLGKLSGERQGCRGSAGSTNAKLQDKDGQPVLGVHKTPRYWWRSQSRVLNVEGTN